MHTFVSVLIATRNRAASLHRTLNGLTGQLDPSTWELVVVDNGSVDETREVLSGYRNRLPLLPLFEPAGGKTRALNRALRSARGDLLVFTDDDVKPSGNWLPELRRASLAHPKAGVFCGPIVPLFSSPVPEWLQQHPFAGLLFARFDPGLREGPLPPPLLPFGPNYAVRASAVRKMAFREDLGPSGDSLLNDEIEFCKRLRRRREEFIFVPTAGVEHYVRPEQVRLRWLLERAFTYGRSVVVEETSRTQSMDPDAHVFDVCMHLNILCGTLAELLKRGAQPEAPASPIQGECLLSPSSLKWLANPGPGALTSLRSDGLEE